MRTRLMCILSMMVLAACTAEVPEVGSVTAALEFSATPDACLEYSVGPLVGEEGQWAAVELDPGPNTAVTQIHYTLSGVGFCSSKHAHRVKVFVSNGGPDDEPFVQYGKLVPAAAFDQNERVVTLNLPHEIAVLPGQRLYLAVQMVWPSGEDSLCWRSCNDPSNPETDYWSPTLDAPFDWTELGEWDLHDQYQAGGSADEFAAGTCSETFFDDAPACLRWRGTLNEHGLCPTAGHGWTVTSTYPSCTYQWLAGADPNLCSLPPNLDGTPSFQWIHQACTRPTY